MITNLPQHCLKWHNKRTTEISMHKTYCPYKTQTSVGCGSGAVLTLPIAQSPLHEGFDILSCRARTSYTWSQREMPQIPRIYAGGGISTDS